MDRQPQTTLTPWRRRRYPPFPPVAPRSYAATIARPLRADLLGDLLVPGDAGRIAEVEAVAAPAAHYATRARGDSTRRVCSLGLPRLRGLVPTWPRAAQRRSRPAGDVCHRRADDCVAINTLRVDLAAIRTTHLLGGIPLDLRNSRLAMVVGGITRNKAPADSPSRPAVPDVLRQLLSPCKPATAALGARDRAMPRHKST